MTIVESQSQVNQWNAPALAARPMSKAGSFDYVFIALCSWLIGGLYLDGWAHMHRRIETFYTPWHLVLYSGFFVTALYLLAVSVRNRLRGSQWRDAIPQGYVGSLWGAGIFMTGGIADLFWHQIFGFERGVEALVSPSHLVLALGVGLLVTGPVRAGVLSARGTTLRLQLPLILSATFLWALLQFFTLYAHPFENTWLVTDKLQSDPLRELLVMPMDSDGELRYLRDQDQDLGQPQWSPDGRQIVYVSGSLAKPATWEIYVMNTDGSNRQRLTNNTVYDGHPAWSPDGKKIIFESHQRGSESIFIMNADGSEPMRWSRGSAHEANPSFAADGRKIAFDSDRDGSWQVYQANTDGSDIRKLTERGQNRAPVWSRDGTKIAFSSDRDGPFQIYVMDVDGRKQTRKVVSESQDEFPVWSPDGRYLAYVAQLESSTHILLLDESDGRPRKLTSSNGQENSSGAKPSWAPSGQQLLFGTLAHARATYSIREALGLSSIVLQTILLMGFIFWGLYRDIKAGGLAIMIVINLALVTTQSRSAHHEFFLVAMATGIAVEWLRYRFSAGPHNISGLRCFGFIVPCVFFSLYFTALGYTSGIAWSAPFIVGTVLIAGATGWLLSLLMPYVPLGENDKIAA